LDQLPTLIATPKTLAVRPDWKVHGETLRLVVPLDINGVTQEGLWLRGQADTQDVDHHVSFQLEFDFPGRRRAPFIRIDWRPRLPHTNRNIGPKDLRLQEITGSHIHPFPANWDLGLDHMLRDNLPIAQSLNEEPASFEALLDCVADYFKIKDAAAILPPPWEPGLF